MNVDAQVDAVTRGVATREADGEPSRIQTLSQTYRSPIADVWDAITNAERIGRWFLPVSGDLRLGGRYQLEGNAGGTVESCEPPADGRASYRATWEFGGGVTWVTVRLTAVDADHTTLELEHVARVADVSDEMWQSFGPAGTGIGWDSGLLGLSLHLTDPASRPEDPVAWTMSEEGRHFMQRSADAWAEEHAKDGVDRGVAAAAAEATFKMYTGEGSAPEM